MIKQDRLALAGALSPYVRDIFLLLILFWEPPFPSLCLHDLFVSALFPDSRNEHNIQVKPVRDSCRTFAGAPGKLSFFLPWFLPWWAARLELLVEEEYRGGWYFIGVAEEGCPDRECLVCGYPGEDIFRQNDPPDRWL